MEVETDRYFSWEDLFDGKTSSLSGFVTSYTKLEKLIETYECATSSRYRTLKSSKHFGKKIDVSVLKKCQFRLLDSQKNSEPYLDYDGIPFLILGKKSLECHQGPDRDGKTNERKQKKSIEKTKVCLTPPYLDKSNWFGR
ncbi:uncharacterized protein LOC134272910 [Saccostrea cucullata]|uniref:uncharacterized protein LOC134272910 n=1 Tax=Saccostrea cuccullata TaxID=36930 RepID=UPI002ED033FB